MKFKKEQKGKSSGGGAGGDKSPSPPSCSAVTSSSPSPPASAAAANEISGAGSPSPSLASHLSSSDPTPGSYGDAQETGQPTGISEQLDESGAKTAASKPPYAPYDQSSLSPYSGCSTEQESPERCSQAPLMHPHHLSLSFGTESFKYSSGGGLVTPTDDIGSPDEQQQQHGIFPTQHYSSFHQYAGHHPANMAYNNNPYAPTPSYLNSNLGGYFGFHHQWNAHHRAGYPAAMFGGNEHLQQQQQQQQQQQHSIDMYNAQMSVGSSSNNSSPISEQPPTTPSATAAAVLPGQGFRSYQYHGEMTWAPGANNAAAANNVPTPSASAFQPANSMMECNPLNLFAANANGVVETNQEAPRLAML